jgi:hypothetical protein
MILNLTALADIVKYENFELRFPLLSLEVIIWGMYGGILLACLISVYCKRYEGEIVRRLLEKEAKDADSALTLDELGLKNTALRRHALRGAVIRKYIRAKTKAGAASDECAATEAGAASDECAAAKAGTATYVSAEAEAGTASDECAVKDSSVSMADSVEKASLDSADESCDAIVSADAPLTAAPLPKDLKAARLYIPAALCDKAYFRYEEKGTGMGVFFAAAAAFLVIAVLLTIFVPELTQMVDNLISYVK